MCTSSNAAATLKWAWERGDTAAALDLHLRNLELFEGLFATASPILLKACMNLLGLPAGPLRPPLVDATGDQVEFARGLLAGVGLGVRGAQGAEGGSPPVDRDPRD